MEFASIRLTRKALLKSTAMLATVFAISNVQRLLGLGDRAQASDTSVTGRATDVLSGRPLAGASVSATPGDRQTQTDGQGAYQMALPPGRYEIRIAARGYIGMSQTRLDVYAGQVRSIDFALIPEGLSASEQEAAQARVLPAPASQAAPPPLPADLDRPVPQLALPCQVWVQTPDTRFELIDLEEYLKGVVPAEMPAYWPAEALKAQAVAARSYAVAYAAANGFICASASCQVWRSIHYATTDAAVDATRGVVATYGGSVIWGFFFSRCNGYSTRDSESALGSADGWGSCETRPWSYLPYCRARSCTGHAPGNSSCWYTGHGVGMCQHGARDRAAEGKGYAQILRSYYTGVTLQTPQTVSLASPADGHSAPGGSSLPLRWTGGMPEYKVTVLDAWGTTIAESSWQSSATWSIGLQPFPATTTGSCVPATRAARGRPASCDASSLPSRRAKSTCLW